MYLRVLKARIQDFERRSAKDFIAPVQIFLAPHTQFLAPNSKLAESLGARSSSGKLTYHFLLLIKITKLSNDVDAPGFLSCFHQAN